MVRTLTQEESSSFETLGSQFFCVRRCGKLGLWSDPKSLGPKVQIQTHGSLKNAFWDLLLNVRFNWNRL